MKYDICIFGGCSVDLMFYEKKDGTYNKTSTEKTDETGTYKTVTYYVISNKSTYKGGFLNLTTYYKVTVKQYEEIYKLEQVFTTSEIRYCKESKVCPLLPMRIPISSPFIFNFYFR